MSGRQNKRKQPKRLKELYYITHIDNIPSILESGIYSHADIEAEGINYTPIYDKSVINRRKETKAPDGKTLWEFANLYFQPRNPMLYKVTQGGEVNEVAILAINPSILNRQDIFITTGNAANHHTEILSRNEGMRYIPQMQDLLNSTWWTEEEGTKRKIMAEVLIPINVPSEYIQSIYVMNHETKRKIESTINRPDIQVIPDPQMFFRPDFEKPLTHNLCLVKGDMFFSGMQTLTISVNTVGVMGKGLASRAKFQFPDVYVRYQKVCSGKNPVLQMGRPYLYKRESSLDYQLADQPWSLSELNRETWFLLFPTKNHWREKSSIAGIEQGLQWIRDNYKNEGIQSLAVPALGCGLGQLAWEDVGPLLCRYLLLDIPVNIHLPLEMDLPDELTSRAFLLGNEKNPLP